MSYSYEIAALGTALLWAIGSMIATSSVRHLGSFAFNRYRLTIAFVLLSFIVLFRGSWSGFDWSLTPIILVSGFVGIFMGDAVLFACFKRLGARRSSVLFAMNAPMTVFLGYIFLGETMSFNKIMGISITIFGVVLAILFGKRKSELSTWDAITPPLWYGVLLGLLGALGQSIGSIVIRPVMDAGADPFMTAIMRVGIAALALWSISAALPKATKPENPINKRVFLFVCMSAFFGLVLGMTLILYAFGGAKAGVVATLSATTPVMVLPMLWITTREAPTFGAWLGAIGVVIGPGLIFLS